MGRGVKITWIREGGGVIYHGKRAKIPWIEGSQFYG